MKAYKGFNKDMTCKEFQYEIGKEYETDKAELCKEGFHACENPIDCFSYYSPSESKFCEVEIEDNGQRDDNSKVVGKKIKIGAEIGIVGIIKATFNYVKERCVSNEQGGNKSALQGGYGSALQGGDCSALRGGDCSALQGGNYSALRGGNYSALQGGDKSALQGGYGSALQGGNGSALQGGNGSALRGGDRSALQGGDRSALQGGDCSALQGGDWSALRGGNCSALRGGYSSALQGGDRSALRGGRCSALRGGRCSVVYGGRSAKVKAKKGSVLVLQYWVNDEFKGIKFKEVDGVKIKEDVFYTLVNGRFKEVKDGEQNGTIND